MAQKVLVDFFGEKVEMFEGNSTIADIAVVINLLAQLVDGASLSEATVYEPRLKADWLADDILDYLNTKYKPELAAYHASQQVEEF